MKKGDDFLIFFLVLVVLFWNPLSYELYYSNQPAIESLAIRALFFTIPLTCLLLGIVVKRGGLKRILVNTIFGFSWVMIFSGILIVGNVIIGRVAGKSLSEPSNEGFIFKPKTKMVYSSPEFDFNVEVNSLGLRDNEIDTINKNSYRILCFGDSWTFGWGVSPEESWPKRLMRKLQERGYKNVEVINCGQPGVYTKAYLAYMKKILPRIKADLILVGVLQLDDLAQLYEFKHGQYSEIRGLSQRIFELSSNFLKSSFGHYIILLQGQQEDKVLHVKDIWIDKSTIFMSSLEGTRRQRFDRLDDTLKSMFTKGELNPTLLQRYIDFPDRPFIFNNPNHPAAREAIELMLEDLKGMKKLAEKYGAPIVFINMPYNQFTGHKVVRMPTDELDVYLQENNRIDSVYRKLAMDNRMDYIELTDHFLKLFPKDSFYFKYDGHPTRHGYNAIADIISEELARKGYFTNR